MTDQTIEEHGEEGEMTLFEHLAELRTRLIKCMIAIAAGFAVSWTWVEEIFAFIVAPLEKAAPNIEMATLNYKGLTEPFIIMLKTALVSGIFFAVPVILWQIWKFIVPALYEHERRLAVPFVVIATGFFLIGSSFCYYFVMPYGFQFLFKFNEGIGSNATLMITEHYDLAVKLLLAFGAVFEMPVVAMFLSAIGLITHHTLIKHWRIAVVGSFIFAAVLTPPDVGTQIAMAIPLVILYGISIGVAYFFTKRRERREADVMGS